MKKIITALSMMAVLLLGACGTSNDPETILTKAYENMQKLESFTMIGKMNITVGSEDESALSIPINLEIKTIRHDLNNPDDDENYSNVNLSLLGESVTTETWSVDGMSYIKMGEGKYYTPLESITSVIDDPKAMAKRVVENCKEINVSKDGDKTILDLVVEEGKLPEVMSFTGAGNVNGLDSVGGDEILKNFKVERLHMLVSNDYHTESLLLEGTTESEGLKMLINMTLDIFDRNSATIPSFNKNEFVSEEEFQSQFGNEYNPIVSDPSGSTSYDFEPYEEIGFDTGETIAIDGNGQTAVYYPVYFDENAELYLFTKDDEVAAYGYFVEKEAIDEIMTEVRNSNDYTEKDDGKGNGYNYLLAFSEKETDLFTEDTPFVLYSYDNTSLGLILVGLNDYSELQSVVTNVTFTLK